MIVLSGMGGLFIFPAVKAVSGRNRRSTSEIQNQIPPDL